MRRRRPGRARPSIDAWTVRWLNGGLLPLWAWWEGGEERLLEIWEIYGPEIVERHVEKHPGTRPEPWWHWRDKMRRRLGGIGGDKENRHCHFVRGMVADWHWDDLSERYGHIACDPNDPPRFEAEATYLKRHGEFPPGEEARLTDKDFEPEVVTLATDYITESKPLGASE
jgi:hypothetical protein